MKKLEGLSFLKTKSTSIDAILLVAAVMLYDENERGSIRALSSFLMASKWKSN